jgi:lipopolysaccharide export system permease protein
MSILPRGARALERMVRLRPGRLLDRYIFLALLQQVLMVLLALLAIFGFFALLEQLDDVGAGRYGLSLAALLVFYQMPQLAEQMAPIAALIGTLICIGSMVTSNEITAMRAGGVGFQRIVAAAVIAALCFGLGALLFADATVPGSERAARQLKALIKGQDNTLALRSGYWARDGDRFVNIRGVRPNGEIARIELFEFDATDELRVYTRAARARWSREQWVLEDITQSVFHDRRVEERHIDAASWKSLLRPDLIDLVVLDPASLAMRDLWSYISYLENNAQDSQRYRQALAAKLVYPLASAAMVLLAIPIVFTTPRDTSLGIRIALGVMIGLVFHVANRAAGDIGLVYGLSPVLAALLPTLFALATSFFMFRRLD